MHTPPELYTNLFLEQLFTQRRFFKDVVCCILHQVSGIGQPDNLPLSLMALLSSSEQRLILQGEYAVFPDSASLLFINNCTLPNQGQRPRV